MSLTGGWRALGYVLCVCLGLGTLAQAAWPGSKPAPLLADPTPCDPGFLQEDPKIIEAKGQLQNPAAAALLVGRAPTAEELKRIGGRRVTLQLKNASVKSAYEGLCKEGGLSLTPPKRQAWGNIKVNMGLKDAPLLWALSELVRESAVPHQLWAKAVMPSDQPLNDPPDPNRYPDATYSGAFRVERPHPSLRTSTKSKPDLEIWINVTCDPNVGCVAVRAVAAEQQATAGGSAAIKLRNAPERTTGASLAVVLAGDGQGIKDDKMSLRGNLQALTVLTEQSGTLDNLMDVRHAPLNIGPWKIDVLNVTSHRAEDRNPPYHQIDMELVDDLPPVEALRWVAAWRAARAEVTDEKGKSLRVTYSSARLDGRVKPAIRVESDAGQGPPAKLVLTVPTELKWLNVPYEFRDVWISK